MSNIALQIKRTLEGTLVSSEKAIFDSVDLISGDISYSLVNGDMVFSKNGRYFVHWWVVTQSSNSTNGVNFALTSTAGDYIYGASSVKKGEVSGIGIIDVVDSPVTLALINASDGNVSLSSEVPVKASLIIVEDKGTPGPMGKRGPAGATCQMRSIEEQLVGAGGVAVTDGAPLLFDSLVVNQTKNISYDEVTGEFIISNNGNYLINWWVAIDGSVAVKQVTFSIDVDGKLQISSSMPVISGQLCGCAAITAMGAPSRIKLINNSGDTIYLAHTPVQGNIVLTEVG